MIDHADREAIVILDAAAGRVVLDSEPAFVVRYHAMRTLTHAIRHLAYPDRDRYPKVRGATKGRPIERQTGD
jgi:hypothetical protein